MWGDIRNGAGEKLDYSYTAGCTNDAGLVGDAGLVVIGHGVTGNKDRPWAQTLAHALSEAGFATLRFSFSGNGESEGRFEDSCPTKESADLASLLDVVQGPPITYVGHSMGGAVGVMRASADPRIARLVSLAGMVDTLAFVERSSRTSPLTGTACGTAGLPLLTDLPRGHDGDRLGRPARLLHHHPLAPRPRHCRHRRPRL